MGSQGVLELRLFELGSQTASKEGLTQLLKAPPAPDAPTEPGNKAHLGALRSMTVYIGLLEAYSPLGLSSFWSLGGRGLNITKIMVLYDMRIFLVWPYSIIYFRYT